MSKEAQTGGRDERPVSAEEGPRPHGGTKELLRRSRDVRIIEEADPRLSRSLEFGLAILERFSGDRPSIGIAALADMIGSSRSTTHRYASTLVELGYLEQGAKRKYRLAPRAASAGMAALGALRLSPSARSVLAALRTQTGCTVGVGVRDVARALYIDRLPGHGAGQAEVDAGLGVGVPVPLHCTALGKAILAGLGESELAQLLGSPELDGGGSRSTAEIPELEAQLERIRGGELSHGDEELRPGARSIAVLIECSRARPIAVDIVAPASRFSMRELTDKLGPILRRTAARVAEIEEAASAS